jgi:hypothetical protein
VVTWWYYRQTKNIWEVRCASCEVCCRNMKEM